VVFEPGGATAMSRWWQPSDPHCCPSLEITDRFKYNRKRGFWLVAMDMTEVPQGE